MNGYEAEYILYLVKRGGNDHWLHHPFGLFKAVRNDNYYEDYCKLKLKHLNIAQNEVGGYQKLDNFRMNAPKLGFSRILGGK